MSGHTPGPWKWDGSVSVKATESTDSMTLVALVYERGSGSVENNARLIAEAGTVATETGLTPRQLAEQRAELLDALENLMSNSFAPDPSNGDCTQQEAHEYATAFRHARYAVAKAKGEQA